MDLDSIAKLAQILFYAGGLLIGALTYRRAKSTILNTVNTEYHKKVIERLADLSEVLYREFDWSSDDAWYKQDDIGHVCDELHKAIQGSEGEDSCRRKNFPWDSSKSAILPTPKPPKQVQVGPLPPGSTT